MYRCIPNGLGATLITIAGLHDVLEVRKGILSTHISIGKWYADESGSLWYARSRRVGTRCSAMTVRVSMMEATAWLLLRLPLMLIAIVMIRSFKQVKWRDGHDGILIFRCGPV